MIHSKKHHVGSVLITVFFLVLAGGSETSKNKSTTPNVTEDTSQPAETTAEVPTQNPAKSKARETEQLPQDEESVNAEVSESSKTVTSPCSSVENQALILADYLTEHTQTEYQFVAWYSWGLIVFNNKRPVLTKALALYELRMMSRLNPYRIREERNKFKERLSQFPKSSDLQIYMNNLAESEFIFDEAATKWKEAAVKLKELCAK